MGQLYSHLVFRPPQICSYQSTNGQIRYVLPDDNGLPAVHSTDLIWLLNGMGFRIPCVFLRRPHAEYVAIYAHQNAEDLGASVRDAHLLSHRLNIDVLAFEYSGYGLSERPPRSTYHSSRSVHGHAVAPSMLDSDRARSTPSEKACCSDIVAAYTYLTDQCDVHPSKIIIFGRSIGSGPAVYCAASRKVGGLVLIAPIASAVRVPLKRLNFTLPFIDTFPNIDRASKIQCPVLVVHGDMDELVPKVHAEKLFGKIQQHGHAVNPLWIPTAKHNNIVEDFHSIVFSRYLTFLDELRAMRADRRSFEEAILKRVSRGSRRSAQYGMPLVPPVPTIPSTPPALPPPALPPPVPVAGDPPADDDERASEPGRQSTAGLPPLPKQTLPPVPTISSLSATSLPPQSPSPLPRRSSRQRRSMRIPHVPCLQARVSLENLSTRAKVGDDLALAAVHSAALANAAGDRTGALGCVTRRTLPSELDDLDDDYATSVVEGEDDEEEVRTPTRTSSSSSVPDAPSQSGSHHTWRHLSLMQCIHPHSSSQHESTRPAGGTGGLEHEQSWHSLSRSKLSFPLLRACLRRFEQDVERDNPISGPSAVPITLQVNPSWQALRYSIESNARVASTS